MKLMSINSANRTCRRQCGFTLIEILVTVIILAIGLLGIAGLQLTGLRYNQEAYSRSQIMVLTNDITDRMRSNRNAAQTGAYDIAIGTTATGASCDGAGANCDANALAASDLAAWKQALASKLPGGDGSIERNGNIFLITIQWDDSRGQQAPKTMAVETIL